MKTKKYLLVDISFKKMTEEELLSHIEKIPGVVSTKARIRTCMYCGDESVAGLCAVHEESVIKAVRNEDR